MKKFRRKNPGIDLGRRQALGICTAAAAAAVSFDPVRALIHGLVDGLTNKAQAGTSTPRNYLYVAFPFGPNRYHFDLPLAPYAGLNNPSYTYPTGSMNPGMVTAFNGTGTTASYKSVVVQAPTSGTKLRMPQIWGWTIPTVGGTWIPMATLLDHMIFIRGITSLDGHIDSQLLQIHPRAGAPTLDGAITDQSTRAVPALALSGSPNIFSSAKGIGNVRLEAISVQDNPLQKILAPFDRSSDRLANTYLNRRQAMDVAISKAMDALGEAARLRNPGAQALWSNRSTAESMIRRGLGDVSSVYSTLVNKYQGLVAQCANEHLLRRAVGVTDRDLIYANFPADQIQADVSPFNPTVHEIFSADLVQPARGTQLKGLAESFAIAEYLFLQGYSSAVTAGCTGISGLNVSGYASWGWDEHGTGSAISMIMNSFAFRGVAACLYEFTRSLKAGGIFDETVIHLGGEFSRAPRIDMKGSDHSPNGNAISLICGAIKQPYVIGNTKAEDTGDPLHKGNFGIGDATDLDGGRRVPSAGNQASTLAHLLRVNSPSPNDASMLYDGSNGIIPTIPLATNTGESS